MNIPYMVYPGLPPKVRKERLLRRYKEDPATFLDEVEKFTLSVTGIGVQDFHRPHRLKGKGGRTMNVHQGIVYARQIFCYLAREILDSHIPLRAIGEQIYVSEDATYDHTSVIYSIKSIEGAIDTGAIDVHYMDDLINKCKIKLYQNLIVPNDILN